MPNYNDYVFFLLKVYFNKKIGELLCRNFICVGILQHKETMHNFQVTVSMSNQ